MAIAPAIDSDEVIDLLRKDSDLSLLIDLLSEDINFTRRCRRVKLSRISRAIRLPPNQTRDWLQYLAAVAAHYVGDGPMPPKRHLWQLNKLDKSNKSTLGTNKCKKR